MSQRNWRYHLAYSTYITTAWNWFLCFAGKAAEPVLFASVLYSGYGLVPGVPQPTALMNAYAFVAQQAALDVGGMNLVKISKRGTFGHKVGIVLIGLMILNTAVSATYRCFAVPANVMLVIENLLLIVRSVMAVLFGHAIRSVEGAEEITENAEKAPTTATVGVEEPSSDQLACVGQDTGRSQGEQNPCCLDTDPVQPCVQIGAAVPSPDAAVHGERDTDPHLPQVSTPSWTRSHEALDTEPSLPRVDRPSDSKIPRNRPVQAVSKKEKEERVSRALLDHPQASVRCLAARLEMSPSTVHNIIKRIKQEENHDSSAQ
jgi:hypothetical protein